MAGWDEGNVFYSDQQLEDTDSNVADAASRHTAQRKFKEFIRSFGHVKGPFPYRESLLQNPNILQVALEDLQNFDDELSERLRTTPADYLPLFEIAAAEVLVGLKSKVPGEDGELEEPHSGDVQVLLTSKEKATSIRALTADRISRLVKITGIIIAASRTKAKATSVTLICKNCKNIKVVACRPGLGGAVMPRSCDHQTQPGEEPCPLDPFVVVPDKSKYVDQQTLKLQENPEDVPTGELPRNLLLALDRNMVQKIVPGTRVTVVGIYSIFQAGGSGPEQKGAIAIRQPYLRVVGMEQATDAHSVGGSAYNTDEDVEFKEFARRPDAYQKVCGLIAPSIFGHDDVKKAVACLLFGGARKRLPDGVRLRGDINVLLLGDPSTAKSQFLKFVEKTAPIAVYTSGKGSSAAGLTASVIRDSSTREFYLEGGAMVLADGGVVCIDEFDKMRPEDRVAIHEAMEQQTISIAKAGITTVLNSRTSVLAAANPPSGRYDDLKTAQENIDLQTTILSRFDLIFIVKDARDHARDMQIARHIVNVHATADSIVRGTEVQDKENWLKRYIEYSKSHCSPRLSDSAAQLLQSNYVKIRQQMRQQNDENGGSPIPITVRQLEAIIRISESLARMQLSSVATEEHVNEAIRLFHVSTLDAARSGITANMVVTPEMRAEIQQVELQVKRRMGIGSFLSERRLIDEIMRTGLGESTIRRALIVMAQRDEIEYRRERRVIVRKA
ncbi:hypothetical protein M758_6G059100 [Ceratodon purpureus]|uniref:DNA replication licensing factor MCM5 n=1 Tax=Ceratodon purpureus TaxID=3225 RepID=A0A8T0HDR4_CERPU|nr:hypothetical protein KC19_6G063200 [Ceratodon purpureus]KAG0612877.1 hypothetical protein M758_6G059100 [Ceratodon purpureus]